MTVDETPPPLALAALAALRRARLRAIEVARATNTCLVVYRDGQIVRIRRTSSRSSDCAAGLATSGPGTRATIHWP
jgi:hypothetical protein